MEIFFKILAEIEIFENFDENRDVYKLWRKSR